MFRWSNAKYPPRSTYLIIRYFTWRWSIRSIHELDVKRRISRIPLANTISLHSVIISDAIEYVNRRPLEQMAHDSSFWNLSRRILHNKYNGQHPG